MCAVQQQYDYYTVHTVFYILCIIRVYSSSVLWCISSLWLCVSTIGGGEHTLLAYEIFGCI